MAVETTVQCRQNQRHRGREWLVTIGPREELIHLDHTYFSAHTSFEETFDADLTDGPTHNLLSPSERSNLGRANPPPR